MQGVLIVNKPMEFTSFDVVALVRKYTGQRKIGHTGTLDPNATGVLPLLLGSATKAQDIIPNHDKEYEAGFRLGITTDTLDIWGNVKTESGSSIAKEELEKIIPEFTGEISQIPPMYSAVQVNGQRLYDLARKGVEVERKSRKVTVYSLKLLSFDEKSRQGKLKIFCSKGTYVRTLIDDIGKTAGVGAVMTSLVRTAACGYKIEDSLTLDGIKQLAENNLLEEKIADTESLFINYPQVFVSDLQAKRFLNGGALDCSRTALKNQSVPDGTFFRVKNKDIGILGIAVVRENQLFKKLEVRK